MKVTCRRKATAATLFLLVFLPASSPGSRPETYTSDFPDTENPISENGRWTNGKSLGLDWADVETVPGLAFGCQSGSDGYDDATALLKGTWSANQSATGTVYSRNQRGGKVYEEVEIRLRSSLSPRRCTGYEILFRCLKTSESYAQIVRWNGPLGDFTYLADQKGARVGISNGDVVKATIVGNVITAYINNVQVAQATDSTYTAGNPGMGFFLQGASGLNRDYGFSSFSASEEPASLTAPHPFPKQPSPPGGQGPR
jgi:hypothetical protein